MSLTSPKKIVVVGDFAVGKTTLINSFIHSSQQLEPQATLGVDIINSALGVEGSKETIPVQFWDISGQTAFENIRGAFLTKADSIIMVFDITRSSTFASLDRWAQEVANSLQSKNMPVLLVGNKDDLRADDSVSHFEVDEMAALIHETYAFNVGTVIISAKTQDGVKEAFNKIASLLIA